MPNLEPDFKDMLSALCGAGADFLLIGVAPLRIDIITSIVGVDFEAAWENRITVKHEGLEVPVIGLDELIRNKQATGREQDKLDARKLEKLRASRQR